MFSEIIKSIHKLLDVFVIHCMLEWVDYRIQIVERRGE
jgi:hypothetical protein